MSFGSANNSCASFLVYLCMEACGLMGYITVPDRGNPQLNLITSLSVVNRVI